MPMSRRARIACVIGGAAVLVTAASGITYATTAASTSTTDYAIACSNSHHALRLINSNGSCPTGYSRINLASAPTPLDISSDGTKTVSKSVTIRGIQVEAICTAHQTVPYIYLSSAQSYDVQGTEVYTGSDGGFQVRYVTSNGSFSESDYSAGAGQITYKAGTGAKSSSLRTLLGGGVTGNVVIVQAGHTFTLDFSEFDAGNACVVEAQVTPSS
jgi:hypothetical protein